MKGFRNNEKLKDVCNEPECSCNKPRSFWVEMDEDWANPTGNICWAYYPLDKPTNGNYIKVSEVKE